MKARIGPIEQGICRVGRVQVDPARNKMRCGEAELSVEPKVMDVLCLLLRSPGQVLTRDELISEVWGDAYPADEGLTRNISNLRRLLRQIDADQNYIETIPKRGYRLIQPVTAAVTQSNTEIERETNASAEQSAASTAQVSALVSTPTLAVLAFDNLSKESELSYLSDGVSEEILLSVSKGTDINVIGRTSSFQYRGEAKTTANIHNKLGATHVLDGSVRKVGDQLRIHAELVECKSDTVCWSERFDGSMSDVFSLEGEIAAAVADALNTAFAPSQPDTHISPAAHDFFLKGRAQLDQQFGSSGMVAALPLFESAVAEAPEFARAWALLAQTRAYVLRGLPTEKPESVTHGSVVEAAATALRLDANCGVAYLALNGLEAWGSYRERNQHITRAQQASPDDPEIIMAAANLSARIGKFNSSLGYAQRAYDIDPMFPVAGYYCAYLREAQGDYEESRHLFDALIERFPQVEYIWSPALLGAASNDDGARVDKLIEQLRRSGPVDRLTKLIDTAVAIRDKDSEFIDRHHQRSVRMLADRGWVDLRLINTMYRLGQYEEAFSLAEQSSFEHIFQPGARPPAGWSNESMLFFRSGKQPMVCDPRFVALCTRLGLSEYWLSQDEWPDCADEDFLPYDFRATVAQSVGELSG